MKRIELVKAKFANFKKLNLELEFGRKTWIYAQNKMGKSSIADGIFWVLFGKSSTGNSEGKEFRPRPYDEQGVDIDHVDVVAELTLLVDGAETVLQKIQRQKWTRKRGTQIEVHEGDTNIFSWNNVEISAAEFGNRIDDIVSESNFQLLTDPTAFFRLGKKEKLDLILAIVAGITEEQILIEVGGFEKLVSMIQAGKTLDEIRATSKRSISDMKEERDRLTASITERSRDIVDMDVSDLELQRNAIKESIVSIEKKMGDSTGQSLEMEAMSKDIMELTFKKTDIERVASKGLNDQKMEIQNRIDKLETDKRSTVQNGKMMELDIQRVQANIDRSEKEIESLRDQYNSEKAKEYPAFEALKPFDETALTCYACGQFLPEEIRAKKRAAYEADSEAHRNKYDNGMTKFESDKNALLNEINLKGKQVLYSIKDGNTELEELKKKLKIERSTEENLDKGILIARSERAELPDKVDLSDNQAYEALCLEISKKEEAMKTVNTGSEYREQLKSEKAEWLQQLDKVKEKFAKYDKSCDAKDRVMELDKQFKEKVQMIADQELILMMCEDFQTAKDNYLTEEVNKHFENVRFQLFRKQKNGGVERVCDVYTKNGSPYGNNTTSGAEKLIVGLEIIRVLSGIIGVQAPVIVDNVEKINEFNLPDMDCQMIMLSVSGDEKIRVEMA